MNEHSIEIADKLIEREDHLVEVFELERKINSILGQAYPFELPVALPSMAKRKASKKKRKAVKKPKMLRLRKLDPETESAYRITYLQQGATRMEVHLSAAPLNTLLNTPLPQIHILTIETVRPTTENQWESVETLFAAPPPAAETSPTESRPPLTMQE